MPLSLPSSIQRRLSKPFYAAQILPSWTKAICKSERKGMTVLDRKINKAFVQPATTSSEGSAYMFLLGCKLNGSTPAQRYGAG